MMSIDAFEDDAKVWIFPCNRTFSKEEIENLSNRLKQFTSNWEQNKQTITSSFELPYNRFIVIIAKNQILNSECIDLLMNEISEIEKTHEVSLMDRLNVSYKQGDYIQYKEMKAFKKMYKDKAIGKDPIVFDNTVNNKWSYKNEWEIPLSESWYRFQVK